MEYCIEFKDPSFASEVWSDKKSLEVYVDELNKVTLYFDMTYFDIVG